MRFWPERHRGPAGQYLSPTPSTPFGPIVIVVDASVLAPALGDDSEDGDIARARLSGQSLAAPELIDLETVSVIRGLTRAGRLAPRRASEALADLAALPLVRAGHRHLITRCWELRDNLTPYDAAYVALAEILQVRLVTADAKLARSTGLRCDVELIHPQTAST